MSDENTIDAPASTTSDSPPESAKADPPVTIDIGESGASGLPLESPKASQPTSASPGKELRNEPRIRVKWHADAFIDGQGMYQGFIKDISLSGTDIFLGQSLQKVKSFKLRIVVPPLTKTCAPHLVEVDAKVIYTTYDSTETLFHTGVKFTKFNLESDRAFLQSRIAPISRVMSK